MQEPTDQEITQSIREYNTPSEAEVFSTIYLQLRLLKESINAEIINLIGEDETEYSRIESIFANQLDEDGKIYVLVYESHPEITRGGNKAPSVIEVYLSCAIYFYNKGYSCVPPGDFSSIIHYFAAANMFLGRAQGCEVGHEIGGNMGMYNAKQALSKAATDALHFENRAMKEKVIQYYKDHYKSFTSKDGAAFQIAENIVPAKFATVRGYLKGVKPD